jgi:fibro-slime domain-containing protein
LFLFAAVLTVQACGGTSGSRDSGPPAGGGATVPGTGGAGAGGVLGTGGVARAGGGTVGGGGGPGGAAGATTGQGGGGGIDAGAQGGSGGGGVDGGAQGGSGGSPTCGDPGLPCCTGADGGAGTCNGTNAICNGNLCLSCGTPGGPCCANNTCTAGCCVGGTCRSSSMCVGPSDDGGGADGQLDAPSGGTGGGGTGGTGGVTGGGTSGTTTTAMTGGAGGTSTALAVCGDRIVVFPERCDDGNNLPFDGCSADCQWEPDCSGSSCTSKCGDGLVLGEECDDGNTMDGDGCSSACTVEPGFVCTQPPLGDRIQVPVIYRDFKFHNPTDFEAGVTGAETASTGMVNLQLDADGKPVYSGITGGTVHVESTNTFATWYRNTTDVNHATASQLVLWTNGKGGYVNRYGASGEQWPVTKLAYFCGDVGDEVLDSEGNAIPCTSRTYAGQTDCDVLAGQGLEMLPGSCKVDTGTYEASYVTARVDGTPLFFPIDGDPFSASEKMSAMIPSRPLGMYDASGMWPWDLDAAGNKILHNFSFTSEIRYWFKFEADKSYKLDIAGDDDVWVFVNKKLAVDLGGIHTPVEGSVTLDRNKATTYGFSPGKVYEVAVFQAERQSNSSTLKITLVGFNTAPSECHPG